MKESDNNVKLIVLDRLIAMTEQYDKVGIMTPVIITSDVL